MQETAKELRKKAYIEKCWKEIFSNKRYYEFVNENGFVSVVHLERREISNAEIKISDHEDSIMARPRSLEGVEYNYGWICIDSEDDLPKEKVKCHFIDKKHGLVTSLFIPESEGGDVEFFLNNATHYQPIPEPFAPLY